MLQEARCKSYQIVFFLHACLVRPTCTVHDQQTMHWACLFNLLTFQPGKHTQEPFVGSHTPPFWHVHLCAQSCPQLSVKRQDWSHFAPCQPARHEQFRFNENWLQIELVGQLQELQPMPYVPTGQTGNKRSKITLQTKFEPLKFQ